MSLKKMTKDDLELMSNKDIAHLIIKEEGNKNTLDIFKKIITLLELPETTIESKIADFYTALATDKRFVLLDDGTWDLRDHHTSDKVVILKDDELEDEHHEDELEDEEEVIIEEEEIHFDSVQNIDNDDFDDKDDDLKDLVIIDEDELELEE